jgi:hypothetical protein
MVSIVTPDYDEKRLLVLWMCTEKAIKAEIVGARNQ